MRAGKLVGLAVLLVSAGLGSVVFASGASATITPESEQETDRLERGDYYEGLAVAEDGTAYMYVAGQDRVVRYAPDGTRLPGWQIDGRFPSALALDRSGNVLVAVERRIERYTADGERLRPWTLQQRGKRVGGMDVSSIEVAPDGSVYLVDWIDTTLVRLSDSGEVIDKIKGLGRKRGDFFLPDDIGIGPDGRIYLIDEISPGVKIFGPRGRFLGEWGSYGTGPGEFSDLSGIAVDDAGTVYVADSALSRVQVFDDDGRYLDQIGSPGSGPGRFREMGMIASRSPGEFVVSDDAGRRIDRLSYAAGPRNPQAQLEFGATRWPVAGAPGRRVRLPMMVRNFGDATATGIRICPSSDDSVSRRILRGVGCRDVPSIGPGTTRKLGFAATMPVGSKPRRSHTVWFTLRSANAGGGTFGFSLRPRGESRSGS